MKNNQVKKRRRKDRTWAEAATLAIQQSPTRMLGIRPILHTIYNEKLKDISMNKAAENVLTTMLNHHAQLPNCPFYRVQGRNGVYALKESWLKNNALETNLNNSQDDSSEVKTTDSESPSVSDSPAPPSDITTRENHTYSIQGRPLPVDTNKKTASPFSNPSYQRTSTIASRRHSSPMQRASLRSNDFKPANNVVISRTNSLTTRQGQNAENIAARNKPNSTFDLETPSSILVHANMRDLINRETFAMLPASYRYKLTMLLPDCDKTIDTSNGEDRKVVVPSKTALTNEFFTQAVQEWRERLSDGEFTRETQSRIVQEIAKERSKIDPWKEKFFEEYYGQRQVSTKRLRSRSQNLAEMGHQVRDLGMEAQLAQFLHLRPEAQRPNPATSDTDSADEDPTQFARVPVTRQIHNQTSPRSIAASNLYKKNRNSFAERLARTKLANSRLAKLRQCKVATPAGAKRTLPMNRNSKLLMQNALTRNEKPSAISSLVMKPSGALSLSNLARHQNCVDGMNNRCSDDSIEEEEEKDQKVLDVRRRSDSGSAIDDHSYTTTTWQRNKKKDVAKVDQTVNHDKLNSQNTVVTTSRSNTTLVLKPRGNFVSSTITSLNTDISATVKGSNVMSFITAPTTSSATTSSTRSVFSETTIRPAARMTNSGFVPLPETERVLSLCARPLTPESFTSKASLATGICQVPSPLSVSSAETNITDRMTLSPIQTAHKSMPPKPTALTSAAVSLHTSTAQVTQVTQLNQPSCQSLLKPETLNPHTNIPHSNLTSRLTFSTSNATPIATTIYTLPQTTRIASPVSIIVKPTTSVYHLKADAHKTNSTTLQRNIFEHLNPTSHTLTTTSHVNIVASPVAPGKLTVTGTKRCHSITPPSFSYPSTPHTRWPTPNSPSPAKKTRTLAEIKAQMKARKAAAASNTRPPLLSTQPHGVVANTRSHIFSATTFPVYFPVVTEPCNKISTPITATQVRPTTPGYVRVNATLPLERVQWVSHPGTPHVVRATTAKVVSVAKSSALHNHTMVGPGHIITPALKTAPVVHRETRSTSKVTLNSVSQGVKGKIILKIKTAGSAISLKVDADVIKKEFNRSPSSNEEDEDRESEEDDSGSEDSDEPKKSSKKKKRSISSGCSSDSEVDICKPNKRWCPEDLDTGQSGIKFHENKSDPPQSSASSTSMLVKANTTSPVFGVSPYSVNVEPTTSVTTVHRNLTTSSLFNQKTNPSFAFNPSTCSWQMNKSIVVCTHVTTPTNTEANTRFIRPASKFQSTSKGKSLQHMQELARTNMIHSDDSAEDSSDDDSTVITTTASEKESDSETEPMVRNTRSMQAALANQAKLNLISQKSTTFRQSDV
ncbi:uncharacterized protein LOC100176097 [Ciona intestinalis]